LSLRDSGNFKTLKTLVKLILNFTRPHTIIPILITNFFKNNTRFVNFQVDT
jgi:hypothetical protein